MAVWSPLGDWPEFRVASVPTSPGALLAAPVTTSMIPWEQGKSLGSFFATMKLAVVASTRAAARLREVMAVPNGSAQDLPASEPRGARSDSA
jgi:hypothetical protein